MRLFKRCKCIPKAKPLRERKRAWRRCPHGYSFSFKLRGDKQQGYTGLADFEAAAKEARRQRVETEAADPGRGQRIACPLDRLEAIDMARVANKGFRDGRSKDIEGLWRPLFRHLGGAGRDVMTMSEGDIERYEGARRQDDNGRGEKVRGQTIREEVQTLRRGIKLAIRDKLIHRSPIEWDLLDAIEDDPPDERQASKPWTDVEIDRALSFLSAKALRAGILELMQFAELAGLRMEELKRYERRTWLRGRELHVPATGAKTGKKGARVIALRPEALRLAKKRERFAIGKPNKALKLACEKAGFTKVLTPRDLRAHRITKWAKRSPLAAQKLAGHTSIATTNRYLHPDAEFIRSVALGGRSGVRGRGYTKPRRKKKRVKSIRARSSAG